MSVLKAIQLRRYNWIGHNFRREGFPHDVTAGKMMGILWQEESRIGT